MLSLPAVCMYSIWNNFIEIIFTFKQNIWQSISISLLSLSFSHSLSTESHKCVSSSLLESLFHSSALIIQYVSFFLSLCLSLPLSFVPTGSTSKGGGVRFPDDVEEDPLSDSCDDTQQDKVIAAVAEPDGTYLVKVSRVNKHTTWQRYSFTATSTHTSL